MIVRRMVKPMTVYTENSVRIDHVTESPNVSSASVIYRTSSMPDFGLSCCDCCHGYSSNSPLFFGRPICASQSRRIASLLGLVLTATIILAIAPAAVTWALSLID
jgi:hypothetical protein